MFALAKEEAIAARELSLLEMGLLLINMRKLGCRKTF
jgi:hypothetical protein